MENENEVLEATNSNEESEQETTQTETEESPATKTYSEQEFKQVLARAKTAEARLKEVTKTAEVKPQQPQNITNNSLSEESVDVKILQSQGESQEGIDYLKKLAKVNGTSVLAAKEDPLYKMWKSNKEAEEKAEKARLGASKGSGGSKTEKSTATPGLSDSEHKQLWLKSQGR